eukprot:TRINITY_DN15288_c0_g1_i1.p1 TRINITY_DN15288_c0_g1~~TRINITY_DN15288_c0_g1_i1.p1  ORF type:complete len:434 (+),score=40.01 TRINITY_DN15288_c0_g1_i1:120-1421(+)
MYFPGKANTPAYATVYQGGPDSGLAGGMDIAGRMVFNTRLGHAVKDMKLKTEQSKYYCELTLGAQMATWIHQELMFEGPASFVSKCMCTGLILDSRSKFFGRFIMELIFLIIAPISSPLVFANVFLEYNLGVRMTDAKHVALTNVEVHEDANPGWVELDNQTTQVILSTFEVQLALGSATVVVFILLTLIRTQCAKRWRLASLMSALNFLWLSTDYPKLRYTSMNSVLLYKLVPCVWAAVALSFMVFLPGFLWVHEGVWAMLRSLPGVGLATFSFGKLYMTASNASFSLWLGERKCHAAVHRIICTSKVLHALQEMPEVIALTESNVQELVEHPCLHERFLQAVQGCDNVQFQDQEHMWLEQILFVQAVGVVTKVMVLNEKADAANYIDQTQSYQKWCANEFLWETYPPPYNYRPIHSGIGCFGDSDADSFCF